MYHNLIDTSSTFWYLTHTSSKPNNTKPESTEGQPGTALTLRRPVNSQRNNQRNQEKEEPTLDWIDILEQQQIAIYSGIRNEGMKDRDPLIKEYEAMLEKEKQQSFYHSTLEEASSRVIDDDDDEIDDEDYGVAQVGDYPMSEASEMDDNGSPSAAYDAYSLNNGFVEGDVGFIDDDEDYEVAQDLNLSFMSSINND